jgi:hypothetical protein
MEKNLFYNRYSTQIDAFISAALSEDIGEAPAGLV